MKDQITYRLLIPAWIFLIGFLKITFFVAIVHTLLSIFNVIAWPWYASILVGFILTVCFFLALYILTWTEHVGRAVLTPSNLQIKFDLLRGRKTLEWSSVQSVEIVYERGKFRNYVVQMVEEGPAYWFSGPSEESIQEAAKTHGFVIQFLHI